jgi:hypothetical protein
LASCGADSPRPASASARPAAERFEEVPAPTIPEPATPCHFDESQLCNSDEETAGVIAGYAAALDEANRRIRWFCVWFGACKAEAK